MEITYTKEELKSDLRFLLKDYLDEFHYGHVEWRPKGAHETVKRQGKPSFIDFLRWLDLDNELDVLSNSKVEE